MRKLAAFSGAFALGIFLAQYLPGSAWQPYAAAGCFAAACICLALPGLWRKRGLLAFTALSLAFGWNWLYVRQVQRPMEALAGTEQTVTMTVCDYAAATDYGAKVTVKLEGYPFGKAVYYGDAGLLDLRPGQTVTDRVSFQSAARIRDDGITTFTSKGVFLLAYQQGEPVYGQGTMESLRWWPARAGAALRRQITALWGDGDTGAFLTAILTGDKSGLSEQASSDLSEAGLYHILAVSGLHCGFLLKLAELLAGRYRRRLLAALTLPGLAFYALLTGCSPSVIRACVMLSLLTAAPLLRREGDGPTSLCAALLGILLVNPFAAASVSLQLSFAAMAGILFVSDRLYRLLMGQRRHGRVFRFLTASFSATMGALVFTVPLSAVYFGFLVLVSPVSNLLCLWSASGAFMTGLAAAVIGFVWPSAAALLALVPAGLVWYILSVARGLVRLPYHALYLSNPYLKYWLGYVYVLFGAAWALRSGPKRRYAAATALAAVTLVITVKLGEAFWHRDDFSALVLDVGQGQCVLLSSDEDYALVDCGSANSWFSPGGIAGDSLAAMGCRELDYLLLTHYDADHINGLEELMARVKVGRVLLPDTEDDTGGRAWVEGVAEAHGVPVDCVTTEQSLPLGQGTLTVYPPLGTGEEDNEQGLSLLASCGDFDLLITGDMDSAAEETLADTYALGGVEALVVGHHGSKYSTSAALLEAAQPRVGIISVGSNRYGHPSTEALRRLTMAGVTICRTDLQGTVRLSWNRGDDNGL